MCYLYWCFVMDVICLCLCNLFVIVIEVVRRRVSTLEFFLAVTTVGKRFEYWYWNIVVFDFVGWMLVCLSWCVINYYLDWWILMFYCLIFSECRERCRRRSDRGRTGKMVLFWFLFVWVVRVVLVNVIYCISGFCLFYCIVLLLILLFLNFLSARLFRVIIRSRCFDITRCFFYLYCLFFLFGVLFYCFIVLLIFFCFFLCWFE